MQEIIQDQLSQAKKDMDKAIDHLASELSKIRAGKASPAMLTSVMVDYYGNPTPINQVANLGTSDGRTITVQPWEKTMIAPIEQAIFAANLGLTPQNNGEMIIINIPALTEERRKELVKKSKSLGEDGKVSLRNVRQKAMETVKKAVKDGYPEDMGKRKEDEIQKMTDSYTAKINKLIDEKENDIMTV